MKEQEIDIEMLSAEVNINTEKLKRFAEKYAEASTAEANKRIEALEGEVAELKEQLSILKPNPLCDTSCLLSCSMEADYAEKQYLENQQLQANNHDLREVLDMCVTTISTQDAMKPNAAYKQAISIGRKALSATPAESLAKRDNKLIEKAVSICQRKYDDYKSLAISCDEIKDHVGHDICIHKQAVASSIGNAIRALKEVK